MNLLRLNELPAPPLSGETAAAAGPRAPVPDIGGISPEQLGAVLQRALGDRYAVLRPIALGGMAVLFQLRHRLTSGLFAAKIMRPELLHETSLRAAFAREARIGAQLAGHPNAVAVLDLKWAQLPGDGSAGEDRKTPFLLMPYVEGEDLDRVLAARGRLGRDEALMLLAQLGSLLMYAETLGVVHADVALGNIRLDRFGQYRLLDYGLARGPEDAPDGLHAIAGTPAFNSPEQLRGERLDTRSDLYSLGLVFFHALTGRGAFATEELDELARAHLRGAWELPAEFADDAAVLALLRSLLAVERERRMRSAFELCGAMDALGYELPSFLRVLPGASGVPRLRRKRLSRA